MFYFFSGLILTCLPFLTTLCFPNKKQGLLTVVTCILVIHIFTALSTQLLGVFTPTVILGLHIFYGLVSLIIWLKYGEVGSFQSLFKILCTQKNLLIALGILLALGYFINIHYNYSGEVRTVRGIKQVVRDFYPYPMYSDEWIGLAFVRSAIEHKSLPLINPFDGNKPFLNLLVVFFSLTAHTLVLFGTDPLVYYSALSIVIALGVLISVFVLLRQYGLSSFLSMIGVFLIPLVVNTSNIPGLLFYLPFTFSFLVFLLSLIAIELGNKKLFCILSICSFLLYPALVVLIIPMCLTVYYGQKKGLIWIALSGAAAVGGIVLLLGYSGFSLENVLRKIFSLIIQENSTKFQSFLGPWSMISFPLFLLSLIGLRYSWQKKFYPFFLSCLIGLVFWFGESFTTHFFVIDHVRIIAITSLMLIVASALGIHVLFNFFLIRASINRNMLNACLSLTVIFLVFYYYYLDSWKKVIIIIKTSNESEKISPAVSHINRYLIAEDLKLFQGIEKKNFLAPPWKSLVLGAATGNFPLNSKSSTLTIHSFDYGIFMGLNCRKKNAVSKKYLIDYVYSSEFKCKGFNYVGKSSENFYLYSTKAN